MIAGYYRSLILAVRQPNRGPHHVIQAITSEGLVQGLYVAARGGVEPATSTNHVDIYDQFMITYGQQMMMMMMMTMTMMMVMMTMTMMMMMIAITIAIMLHPLKEGLRLFSQEMQPHLTSTIIAAILTSTVTLTGKMKNSLSLT